MSQHDHHTPANQPQDMVESPVPMVPIVLPIAGAIPIFLLAFVLCPWPDTLATRPLGPLRAV